MQVFEHSAPDNVSRRHSSFMFRLNKTCGHQDFLMAFKSLSVMKVLNWNRRLEWFTRPWNIFHTSIWERVHRQHWEMEGSFKEQL